MNRETVEHAKEQADSAPLVKPKVNRRKKTRRTLFSWFLVLAIVIGVTSVIVICTVLLREEVKSSRYQAQVLSDVVKSIKSNTVRRSSSRIRFPKEGPYDNRLGYTHLSEIVKRLTTSGYVITRQAQISAQQAWLIDHGIFALYNEKFQAGLDLLGRDGGVLHRVRYPTQVYHDFFEIPDPVVQALLFIEDRHVLTKDEPFHNPAIEWDRFTKAILDVFISKFYPNYDVHGGSTLATQTEKFRHSREGRTQGVKDKILQMATASMRSYLAGPSNLEQRRKIVLGYINSVPLAAIRGFGEVNGLGDGMWAYYGQDFIKMNTLLSDNFETMKPAEKDEYAIVYRRVLSLFLAHRRPSDYLGGRTEVLDKQIKKYIPILMAEGRISPALAEHLKKTEGAVRRSIPKNISNPFLDNKTSYTLRAQLLKLLGVPSLYDLDRFDLQATSTVALAVQEEVMNVLQSLKNTEFVKKAGLYGHHMFTPSNDLKKMISSVTLYEKTPTGNLLRVQADNFDQPLNISEGVKLDLGSTSKLRTLITYLQVIERIYFELKDLDIKELKLRVKKDSDPLTQWMVTYLINPKSDKNITAVLNSAMERKYSASPGESFFTAGGLHTFHNFNKTFNGSIVNAKMALRHSINLPFIRMMRDLVRYFSQFVGTAGVSSKAILGMSEESRLRYLKQFADTEGKKFLGGFYKRYKAKLPEEITEELLKGTKRVENRLGILAWEVALPKDFKSFNEVYEKVLGPKRPLTEEKSRDMYDRLLPYADILADRAYVAGIHPLELWVSAFLYNHTNATLKDAIKASDVARQDSYRWLFKTRHKGAQDKRIRIIVESEAFQFIHREWKKVGYPHSSLVPSYASALGVSADTPDALAKLVGILLNDGMVRPYYRMSQLHFAVDTPYETLFQMSPKGGKQVVSKEICDIVRAAMLDVTQAGTAVRIKDGLSDGENRYLFGGKTGTGDHRQTTHRRGGGTVSEVKNRSANFTFYLGENFFGTITLFVPGSDAAKFSFTSSLAVQIMKQLEPALAPMLRRGRKDAMLRAGGLEIAE
jgi:membrane peptidoglycan carboxypeptidase